MLTQRARSKRRSGGYHRLHTGGGGRRETPANPHQRPDGSIDYELFKLRARQLQTEFLAELVSAARRELLRALKAAGATIRHSVQVRPVACPQRR